MAQNASFTINDGTTDHVFAPSGIEGSKASYQNKAEDYIPGRETAVLSHRTGKTVREVTMTIRIPKVVTETLNGVDVAKVASFGSMSIKALVPLDWTPTETGVLLSIAAGVPSVAAYTAAATEDEWVW